MIDERELQEAIQECIDNPSSANVCQRLASYMVIQDHLFKRGEDYSQYSNANEVLPAYDDYAEAKRLFQNGEGNEQRMIDTLNALLSQIKRLIQTLYASAQTNSEKSSIAGAIQQLNIGNL